MNCPNAPEEIREGTATSGDGTIRGHRASITNFRKSGVVTDDWLSRAKMNTYVNCERDSCVTGAGSFHLENYSFLHQVLGQPEAIECVLRPGSIGYQKRYHVTWNADRKSDG